MNPPTTLRIVTETSDFSIRPGLCQPIRGRVQRSPLSHGIGLFRRHGEARVAEDKLFLRRIRERAQLFAPRSAPDGSPQQEKGDIRAELLTQLLQTFRIRPTIPESIQSEQDHRCIRRTSTQTGPNGNPFLQKDPGPGANRELPLQQGGRTVGQILLTLSDLVARCFQSDPVRRDQLDRDPISQVNRLQGRCLLRGRNRGGGPEPSGSS